MVQYKQKLIQYNNIKKLIKKKKKKKRLNIFIYIVN